MTPEMLLARLTNTELRVKYLHLLDIGGAFIDVHCAVKILHMLENIRNKSGVRFGGTLCDPTPPLALSWAHFPPRSAQTQVVPPEV